MNKRQRIAMLFGLVAMLILIGASLAYAATLTLINTTYNDFNATGRVLNNTQIVDVGGGDGDIVLTSTDALDQSQTSDNNYDRVYGPNYEAQTFRPGINGLLYRVTLRGRASGSPPNPVVLELRNISGTYPNELPGTTVYATAQATFPTGSSYYNVNFDFSAPYNVSTATRYALVIRTTGGDQYNNYYRIRYQSSNVYANGRLCYSSDSGSSWTGSSSEDVYFQTYIRTYATNGTYESAVLTADPGIMSWGTLSWSADAPGTVQFRIATSNSSTGPWTYYGPGGSTTAYYTTSGTPIWSGHGAQRYIRYQATLNGDGISTPELHDVTIAYNAPPPVPVLISPGNGSATNNQRPLFEWQASTGATDYQIQVSTDSTFATWAISQTVVAPTTSFQPTSDLAPATYYWRVRAYDGTYSDWAYATPWSFTIDIVDPQSQAVSPLYATAPFPITTTGVTDLGSPATGVYSVALYYRLSTGAWLKEPTDDLTSPYQWNPWTPPAGNGLYYLQTVAYDRAGNHEAVPSGSSGQGDTQTTYDTVAPTTPVISSSTHPDPALWYNNNDPQFSWTASDATSDIAGYSYLIDHSGATDAPQTINTTQTTLALTDQPDGDWYLHVRARDNAGNWGATGHYRFRIDTTPPTSSVGALQGTYNVPPISIPWTASDPSNGIASVQLWYRFAAGSWTYTGLSQPGTSGTFSFTPSNGDGQYCFYTFATDNAGNPEADPSADARCTTYRNRVTIGDFVWLDANGDGVQNDGSGSGIDGVALTLSQGATTISTTTTAGGGSYLFSNLPAGTYTVTVDAINFTASHPLYNYTATGLPNELSPRVVTVAAGQDYQAADFGYGPFAVITGTIYRDLNRDAHFDPPGETGLPNITVWLYTDDNGNGIIDGTDTQYGQAANTDSGGRYTFRGARAGNYTVLADELDPQLPVAYQPTGPNPVAVANAQAGETRNNVDIGFNTPPPVTKPLYLKSGDILNRNLPTGSNTALRIADGSSRTWQQSPVLADRLIVLGQPFIAALYLDGEPCRFLGYPQGQPYADITLSYEGGDIATTRIGSVPGGVQLNTVTLTPSGPVTLNAGQHLSLEVAVGCSSGWTAGAVTVYYDGGSYPSAVSLPTYSYLRTYGAGAYDAAYPGGSVAATFIQGRTAYLRVTATDPFGAYDISGATLNVPDLVTNTAMSVVTSGPLTRTYQTAIPSLASGYYTYTITTTEGLEGAVWATDSGNFRVVVSNLGNSTKTVNQTSARPGDALTYTIVLSNTGDLTATVRMTDSLPPNVTYADNLSGPTGTSYDSGLHAVLFNGQVGPNRQATISYQVTVNTPLDYGTVIANSATVEDSFSRFETTPPAQTTITSAPDLSTSVKRVNLAAVRPGNPLDYTIILTNTGDMNAYIGAGNPLLDPIPANTAYHTDDGGLYASGGSIGYDSGFNRIEWYGTVPAGGSVTLGFRTYANFPLDNGTLITNTATINEGTGFPAPQTYTRTATTTIQSAPNLAARSAKVVDKTLANPGDPLAYTIRLWNDGDMNAPGAVLTDTLPVQVDWAGDVYLVASSGTAQYFPITRTLVWNGDLNARQLVEISFLTTLTTPLANNTQVINTALVWSPRGDFAPLQLSALTTVSSHPDLSRSTKTVSADTASPGDPLTYTLRLINIGNATANAVLTDTLPAEVRNPAIVSVSGGQAGIVGGTQITWTGQVTPGLDVVIIFRVDLLPVLNNNTRVRNYAFVYDGYNPLFYITPLPETVIYSAPQMGTSLKMVDRAIARPSELLTYTVTLTNTGNMVANALVRDVLPPNVTFHGGLSASPGAPLPTYSSINNRVSWQGNVVPGTPITFSYQVLINTPLVTGTVILNDAEINDGFNTPFDTTPPAQTTIWSAPNLSTSSKSVDLPTASPGGLLHYTVRLINTGDMIAASTSLSDTIPAEVTFASGPFVTGGGSGGWNPIERRVFWSGSVAPDSDVIVEYYATVNDPLPNGTYVVNDAVVQGSFGSFTTNQVTTTVTSDHELHLIKSAPSAIGAGQRMTYTLQYNVTGHEPAYNVLIVDSVPTSTTYVRCGGITCTQSGGVVTFTLGNLVPGNSGTAYFVVDVSNLLPNGTLIDNVTSMVDSSGRYAESSVTTQVTSGHGFSLSKSDSVDPVQAGGGLVYTLTWSVAGTEVAQGVVITDALPVNTTFSSCSDSCSGPDANRVITWTLGSRNPGASGSVTVAVAVATPLPNGTLLTNQVYIADGNGGLPTTASEQTTVRSSHSLGIVKTGPDNVAAGGQITYTIVYSVTGNETALDLTIADTTPANTTFASASGGVTIESPSSGNSGLVRWHLGDVAPGTQSVVTLTVNVNSPLPNGTPIDNTATIADTNGGATRSSSFRTTVTSGHGFILTKSDTPDPVSPNGLINYIVHWQVTGNEMAHGVVITDAIPANTSYETCGACVWVGDYVSWDIGDRNPGASGDVFLQVHVTTPLVTGTVIVNNARISDANNGTPVVTSTTTTVHSAPDLSPSTKGVDQGTASPGARLHYTITLNNAGDMNATNVTVTDTLPLTYGTLVLPPPAGAVYNAGAGTLTWSGLTVNRNQAVVLSFDFDLASTIANGTRVVNHADIGDGFHSGALGREAATIIGSAPNLQTSSKVVDHASAAPNDLLIYTITLRNSGNAVASGARVTDTLPVNTTWDSWVTQNGAVHSGNLVTWQGNVTPGVDQVIAFQVRVNTPLDNGTVIANSATVNDGVNPVLTLGPVQTTIGSAPNLQTSLKSVNTASAAPGQTLTYTITLTNSGNMTAHYAVVLDDIPQYTTYVNDSATATSGTVYQSGGRIRWSGEVVPGINVVITFRVAVNTPLDDGRQITNFANVDDGIHGPVYTNEVTTTIHSTPDLSTSFKTVDPTDAVPGQVLHYIITLRNTGNMMASAARVTDTIPASTTIVPGSVSASSGTAIWDAGNRRVIWSGMVVPGPIVTIEYWVTVNSPLDDGALITNTATANDGVHPAFETAPATQTVIHSAPDLSGSTKTVNRTVAAPGEVIDYTITLHNTGTMNAANAVMTDTLPTGVGYENNLIFTGGTATYDPALREIHWSGPVNVGQPVTIGYRVRLDVGLPSGTLVTNTATVDDGRGHLSETTQAVTTIGFGVGLSLTDGRYQVQPGEWLTYTIAFSGTDPMGTGHVLEVSLPANTSFVNASMGYQNLGDGFIRWTLPQQPPNFYGERILVVAVATPLDNGTEISATAALDNNRATDIDIVVSHPDLSTSTKVVSNPGARANELVTYHITLTNTGNMQARRVIITDALPASMIYEDNLVASSGVVTFTDGEVRWSGQVLVGTPVDITFGARVAPTAGEGEVIDNIVAINDGFYGELPNPPLARIVVGSAPPRPRNIYLPLILGRGSNTPPVGSYDVELTIRNCGNANAIGAFWVDLYLNPNERSPYWPISHGEGYDWFGQGAGFTVSTLGAGQSYTLRLSDAVQKDMPATLTGTPRLYGQVDWVDATIPGRGVVWEGTAGEQNNVADSNGATCAATPGLPDLIVESIRMVSVGQQVAPAASLPALEGGAPAPERPKPPQR